MIAGLLIVLAILWFLGYVHIGAITIPNLALFSINGQEITLWTLLIFLVIAGLIGILPSPIRQIVGVVFLLWILSVLGIFAFANISSLLVIGLVVGLIVYLFSSRYV